MEARVFNRILVPLDGSETASAAVGHALRLGRIFDSTLVALYVVDVRTIEGPLLQTLGSAWGEVPIPMWSDDLLRALRARGEEALAEVVKRAEGAQGPAASAALPVETELVTDFPADAIVDRARSADLVVLGRRGEHAAWGSSPLGSTVHAVVRRSAKPVLVCPPGDHPPGPALAAYDGSEHAIRALEVAVRYAERTTTPLHVVSVQTDREEAERLVEEARVFARGHDLEPEVHVREDDDPAPHILAVARQTGAEVIVMGAYGKGRLRKLFVGSTTETVLSSFDHPVLLYR
jgi:nucleotide-binding universal stress UspA family protein